MEGDCKEDVTLRLLIQRRRMLSDLRSNIIQSRERNNEDVSENQNQPDNGEVDDQNMSILSPIVNNTKEAISDPIMEKPTCSLVNHTWKRTPDKIINHQSKLHLDYDSDDSVKDKNYEPEDDYNSSCSEISNTPTKVNVSRVKKRIFSEEKMRFHKENYQKPMKRQTPYPELTDASVNTENNFALITLEDLIDTSNKSQCIEELNTSDEDYFDFPHIKKPRLDSTIANVNGAGNFRDKYVNQETIFLTPNSKPTKALVMYKPNSNSLMLDAISKTKMDVNLSDIVSMDRDLNRPTYGVMSVDNDGTIYLPNILTGDTQMADTSPVEPTNQESKMIQKVKKKVVDPTKWKRRASKIARMKGSPYHSTVAKKKPNVEGRQLKPPCSCKAQCHLKITADQRLLIFNQFWKTCKSWDQRRQYIIMSVKKNKKRMMKTDGDLETDRRKFSYTYSLTIGDISVKVCKVMYLNTLSVGEKFVKISIEKQLDGGLAIGDQRGKHAPGNKSPEQMIKTVMDHINSYPAYESHYSRQKSEKKYLGPELNIALMYSHYKKRMQEEDIPEKLIAKECLYRNIFNTKFNLSFKLPSLDTCDDCDAYQRKLKDVIDETEKKDIEKEYEAHSKLAEERYILKKNDKEEAKNSSEKKKVLMFDLQKCLATPNLTNTKSFYLRKLWTLNLTIFDATDNTATNLLWSENISGRGGNEIASCLLRWANENQLKLTTIEELTFWSDNCAGQNRNLMIVIAYIWLLHQFPNLKVINHKFMLKGHTHMEVDQIHSQIERKKKQLKTMQIAIPRDWSQFIRTCGGKRNFDVFDMELSHFKDFTSLYKSNGPLVQRKKNKEGEEFKISECVFLQLKQDRPGVLFYKRNFSDEFSEICLVRTASRGLQFPTNLPDLRQEEKPISSAKYRDLISLLQWVPREFHEYYKKLKHNDKEGDFPEAN